MSLSVSVSGCVSISVFVEHTCRGVSDYMEHIYLQEEHLVVVFIFVTIFVSVFLSAAASEINTEANTLE